MKIRQEYMTINLAKGHFNAIEGHRVLKANFNDLVYPSTRYLYQVRESESRLPDIASCYRDCLTLGYNQFEIIDKLVKHYFPLRFFRVGDYEEMALVLGFIGMRGSGKTCSAVIVAVCDYLLRGLPVWSNVPINIRVCYKDAEWIYRSLDLAGLDMLDITQDYGGGCVLYDEVNMEAAEGTRFSSGANLQFSYALQQIRKRQLSLIWTCQGWNWLDNRLRFATDFCIACRDASMDKGSSKSGGIGDTAVWRVHDLSGTSGQFPYDYELKHRYVTEYKIGSNMNVWMRPWWPAYDTEQLQGQHDYIRDYRVSRAEKVKAEANRLPGPLNELPGQLNELPGETGTLTGAIDNLIASGLGKIYCSTVWQYLGTTDRSVQTRVGQIFADRGYIKAGNGHSGYYWKKRGV